MRGTLSPSILLLAVVPLASCAQQLPRMPSHETLVDYPTIVAGAPPAGTLPTVASAAPLPSQFNLVAQQSPVRTQGLRGTCTFFATLGLMEQLYRRQGAWPQLVLSEQWLDWAVKKQLGDGAATDASSPDWNAQAIAQIGVVQESDDPYDATPWGTQQNAACQPTSWGDLPDGLPVDCYTQGDPPASAQQATRFTLPGGHWINPDATTVKSWLVGQNSGVIASLRFYYQSWNDPDSSLPIDAPSWWKGIVRYPNDADRAYSDPFNSGHAVLIVGYDDLMTLPLVGADGKTLRDSNGNAITETGFYVFKNSWGTDGFGVTNPYAAGYGFLSERYLNDFGQAFVLSSPTQIPTPPSATPTPTPAQHWVTDFDDTSHPLPANDSIDVTNGATIHGLDVYVSVSDPDASKLTITLDRGNTYVPLWSPGSGATLPSYFVVDGYDGTSNAGAWTLKVTDGNAGQTLTTWGLGFLVDGP